MRFKIITEIEVTATTDEVARAAAEAHADRMLQVSTVGQDEVLGSYEVTGRGTKISVIRGPRTRKKGTPSLS